MANNAHEFQEGEQLMLTLWGADSVEASASEVMSDADLVGKNVGEVSTNVIESDMDSVFSNATDMTLTCEALSSAAALIVAETIPESAAQAGETENRAEKKEKSEYPKFVPAVRFGATVQSYDGYLYLSPMHIFHITANRQSKGFYAISGMITMQDPGRGGVLQETGDRRKAILEHRTQKGLAPVTGKGSYATAVKCELNIKQQNDKNYAKAIKETAISKAQCLMSEHKDQVTEQILHGVPAEKLTLGAIFSGYGTAYLDDRTRSDDSRRKYARWISGVVNVLGDVELGDWSKRDLIRKENENKAINPDSIKEVLKFLSYFASKRRITNPAAKCLREYLEERGNLREDPEELQEDATSGICLPSEVERFLDQECWANLGDPRYAFIMLAKEGGLAAGAICSLKVQDICCDSEDVQKIFVNFRRDNLKSATHDYTFSLFPFGAVYVNAYLAEIAKVHGADRVSGDCYLLSKDPSGKEKYDVKTLQDFINEILSHHKIGYAELANLEGRTKKSRGIFLLHKTYKGRVNKVFCDPGRKAKDDGAATFMEHGSLVGSVQLDHYRALTDFTGRNYLYGSVCNDTRDPMQYCESEKRPYRRKSTRMRDGRKELCYPASAGRYGRVMEIELKDLKAGDEVTFEAEHGLLVAVITRD